MYYVSSGDPNGLLPGFVKNMITEAVAKNLERVIVFVAKKNLIKIWEQQWLEESSIVLTCCLAKCTQQNTLTQF